MGVMAKMTKKLTVLIWIPQSLRLSTLTIFVPTLHSGLEVSRELESRRLPLYLEIEVDLQVCKFLKLDRHVVCNLQHGSQFV